MGEEEELTIDELASRAGMTVRNVRAYQSRGLLPPPEIRGRTGYYGSEHLARLELVKELQGEGFNLEAIKRVIERAPTGATGEVLDFTRRLSAPFSEEEPEIVDISEFAERWGEQFSEETLALSREMGFVRLLGGNRVEIVSPRLDRAATELARVGVPLEEALEVARTLRHSSEAVAERFAELYVDHVLRPFQEAGEPEERWQEMRETLERLRPLASEALLAMFGIVMTETAERVTERELARIAEEGEGDAAPGSAGGRGGGGRGHTDA